MEIQDIEKLLDSKLEDISRRFDSLDHSLEKLDDKMDTTCERLTVQETKYASHIEQEQNERSKQDKRIDTKYQFITLILGGVTTILAILQAKSYF